MTRIRVSLISISMLTALSVLVSGLLAAEGPGPFTITACSISDATEYTLFNSNGAGAVVVNEFFDESGLVAGSTIGVILAGGSEMYAVSDYVPAAYEGYAIISSDFPLTLTVDVGPGAELLANFEADPPIGAVPLTVDFMNTSSGFDTSLWSFGDGITSTATSPSHTYTMTGLFAATLTVSHTGCLTHAPQMNPTVTQFITVDEAEPEVFIPVMLNP